MSQREPLPRLTRFEKVLLGTFIFAMLVTIIVQCT